MTWGPQTNIKGPPGTGSGSVVIATDPPPSPTHGDLWWESDSGGLYVYYSDGTSSQWVIVTGGGSSPSTLMPAVDATPGSPGSSVAYARGDHVHPTDTSRVAKTGDVMSGALAITSASPSVVLNRAAASSGPGQILSQVGSPTLRARWSMRIGDGTPEATPFLAANTDGSLFLLRRYNDGGAFLGDPITISRADGRLLLEGPPTEDNHAATKKYVDDHVTSATRETLTAPRNYFVRTDGDDANDGRSNAAGVPGGAFKTVQKAVNVVMALDISVYNVNIILGIPGDYVGNVIINGPWVGSGTVTILGDAVNPSGFHMTVTAGQAVITAQYSARLTVRGVKFTNTSSIKWLHVWATTNATIRMEGKNEYGNGLHHLGAETSAAIIVSGSEIISSTVTGGSHWYATQNGVLYGQSTLWEAPVGGCTFSYFARASFGGVIYTANNIPGGGRPPEWNTLWIGQKYYVTANGVIQTAGGGEGYFPGTIAGAPLTGGQYV